jgi:sulfotransferase
MENKITGGFFSETNKTFYFMAGLPRSGSTVLSTILNQNPKFYSGPSSPVLSTMFIVENHLQNDELFHGFPKPEMAEKIISSIAYQFYSDRTEQVIIDKNRAWTSRVPYIEGYIKQKAKIICPVRDIDEILTSMITMIRRNPFQEGQERINFVDEQLIKLNIPINDDNRCEYVGGPQGILGQSLNSIVECFEQGYGDRVHFVEYRDLINEPNNTIGKIYEFLEEDLFEHEFTNLINSNRENDLSTYGINDMHYVHPNLEYIAPEPKEILSESVLEKCKGMDVWRKLVK